MNGCTTDSATNNDTMVDDMEDRVPSFEGSDSHGRCFGHVANLGAKSCTSLFDTPKKKKTDALTLAEQALFSLAEQLEEDDFVELGLGAEDISDLEGWIDEREEMDEEKRAQLEASVLPSRLVIVKVRVHLSRLSIRADHVFRPHVAIER